MKEKFAQYRERLTQTWSQMGRKQKVWLGASIGGILLTIILLTVVFTRTEYELAFKNLDENDAYAVIQHLEENGIPYELSSNGKNISVPSKVASRVKIDAGSQGLVQNGSIGFEMFANSNSALGTTDNEFNVQYQHAYNGEIQKLLNSLQGIERTEVLVNRPEESIFLTPAEANKATAGLTISFKPGYKPSQKEIDGYYNLVKASVPELELENIVIINQMGEQLVSSEVSGQTEVGLDAIMMQFQIQQKFEAEISKNVKQYLGSFVDMNKTVVTVASSINFDKKLSKEELVAPLENNNNNGIIISEQINNSSSTNAGGMAGGVAGTGETDVPSYDAGTEGNGSSETNNQTRNYDVNRISNSIESAPFVLKDLTLSVVIDETEIADEASKAQILQSLTTFVRGKLADSGQDVNNDQLMEKKVSLIARSFGADATVAANTGLSTGWVIGIGAGLVALIGGLIFMLVRKRKQQAAEEEDYIASPSKMEFPTLDTEHVSEEDLARKNLETLAKQKPDEFVNLLRTWLVDE
ncbi:flagellar basal-body MS-ring/collar protein FliF [Paenibacillus yanchengensis]|uniref:Flagellar basal-body MS-ring/collar protein FliF n=1 Tax=Paenibacillus yanchengensis TaxID=2035833 RepID=A0ABW4YMV6_9BACL